MAKTPSNNYFMGSVSRSGQDSSLRPILRWAGSKRALLPRLREFWEPEKFKRYVEPFAGSASLFFSLAPKHGILNDINADLVEVYRQIRNNPGKLHAALELLPLGRTSYYQIRAILAEALSPAERAARFIFLNRYCFNGLYRTNLEGQFNVPFSATKTGRLPSFGELMTASELLRRAEIYCGDFEEILDRTNQGDFVYMDPPYAVESRRVFREYGPKHFRSDDLKRLANALRDLHRRKVVFVVSYALCREALAAFDGWCIQRALIQRNISGFAEHRRRAVELLVTNVS